jgi:hypothetical protein
VLLSRVGRLSEVGEDGVSAWLLQRGALVLDFSLDDPRLKVRVARPQYLVVRVVLLEVDKEKVMFVAHPSVPARKAGRVSRL